MKRALLLLAATALLAACGEQPQTLTTGSRADKPAFEGTGVAAFQAGSWKAGDKTAWEQQLKVRAQGQNDYAKAN